MSFLCLDKTRQIFEAFERVLKTLSSTVRLLPRIVLKLFNRIEGDDNYGCGDGIDDGGGDDDDDGDDGDDDDDDDDGGGDDDDDDDDDGDDDGDDGDDGDDDGDDDLSLSDCSIKQQALF
jgi:hypothetical protein